MVLFLTIQFSIISTKLNLFYIIQFNIIYLFAHSLNVKECDSLIGPYQVLPLRAKVDLGAMAMKIYFTFNNFSGSLSVDFLCQI